MSTPAIQAALKAKHTHGAASTLADHIKHISLSKLQLPSHDTTTTKSSLPYCVLVACGSYSPVTNMHLRIFDQARNHLQYDINKFNIIGGYISPVHDTYGKSSLVPAPHRMAMCAAALQTHPWLDVSGIEVEQSSWTPTAEVLDIYAKVLNDQLKHDISVLLLCGADLLSSVLVPDLWASEHLDMIFGTHGVAVIERTGMDLDKLIDENEILRKYKHNIHIVPQTISNTISSTSVRDLLSKNQSVRYLIPDETVEYIVDNELYGVNKQLYRQRHLHRNT